jgi:AcrR family transcriptional regulator
MTGEESMPTRKRMTGQERREKILAAARQNFLRYGFEGTKTRFIAREAGVTEAVLYRHFTSKEQLFEEAVGKDNRRLRTDLLMRCRAVAEAARQRDKTEVLDAERGLYDAMVDALPMLGAMLFAEPEAGKEFYRTHWLPRAQRMVQSHTESFTDLSNDADEDREVARQVLSAIFGVNFGFALHEYFSDGAGTDRDLTVAALTDMLSTGAYRR